MESKIDFYSFRALLESLENSETSIRLRMSGEGWTQFAKLILLSESAMIVQDDARGRVIMNLRSIVEFEIDAPALDLKPFRAYEVVY